MSRHDRKRITKSLVDDLAYGAKRYVVWDKDLPAFCVEVLPSGVKAYRLMYRAGGRLRNLTLGRHGSITAAEARDLAEKALGTVAHGGDPAGDKARARGASRFDEAFEDWLDRHVRAKRKPATQQQYELLFEKHFKPRLGARRVADIARADVSALHKRMRKTPYAANRAVACLRSFFTWTERQGIRPDHSNPARLIEFYRETSRERLLSPEEIARLGVAIKASDGEEWPYALAAIKLLLFTGARRGEILALRWAEIDEAASVARLPDSKTGAKTLHLGSPARKVLASIPRQKDNPYVICGRLKGGALIGLPATWRRVRKRAGLPDLRLHDLRHAFASSAAMGGTPLLTIGRLLGHSQPAVTDRYSHFASAPLVLAADRISESIAAQLDGPPREKSGLRFRRQRRLLRAAPSGAQ